VTVEKGIRNRVLRFLQEQVGNNNRPYVAYYNSHAGGKKVSTGFAWCAEFAWCSLDQCASLLGMRNPVNPCCHVSEIANQARKKGALKNAFSSGYVPKKGDLFTTSTVKNPGTSGRLHIGFVESVETDSKGQVTRVHTIEGNFNWENASPASTKVSRSVWTIGQRRYGGLLCEYIDIEKLFS
ncbi:MAG: CHAP domain-containing protein, partial [Ruminococcus sp.]|nr:CHAP domain-containing protein [Ruminococcus sp.]